MKRLREQFRGLYWRQMSITVGMVLLTLVLLGTVFFSLSYNYARGQKTDELLERAQVVSRLSVRYLESGRYLTMEELRQDQVFQQLPIWIFWCATRRAMCSFLRTRPWRASLSPYLRA